MQIDERLFWATLTIALALRGCDGSSERLDEIEARLEAIEGQTEVLVESVDQMQDSVLEVMGSTADSISRLEDVCSVLGC